MVSKELLMMRSASDIAGEIRAKAIVSFLDPMEFASDIPIIWVEDLQLDVLKDLTMHDILEVSEKHLHDAAVQIYLSKQFEEGVVVGVFPHAVITFDIKEGSSFINVRDFEDIIPRDVMSAILKVALELCRRGREGRHIGSAFIVGDESTFYKQAISNPFKGQRPEDCDIKNEHNWESIKEFAQLDGVFIVNTEGLIVSAGRYLNINTGTVKLPGGMGGRHLAAAAITMDLPVVGVTVSESGGIVRVFRDGICVMTIRSDIRIR